MEHLKEKLSAYLDGELGRAERDTVEAHLSGCGSCRAILEAYRAQRAAIQAWPVEDLSPGFEEAFWARLGKDIMQPLRWWVPLPAFAAALALVGVVGALYLRARLRVVPAWPVRDQAYLELGLKAFADVPPNSLESIVERWRF